MTTTTTCAPVLPLTAISRLCPPRLILANNITCGETLVASTLCVPFECITQHSIVYYCLAAMGGLPLFYHSQVERWKLAEQALSRKLARHTLSHAILLRSMCMKPVDWRQEHPQALTILIAVAVVVTHCQHHRHAMHWSYRNFTKVVKVIPLNST